MKPELSNKVSLGLKTLAVVLIIFSIKFGSHAIHGGVNRGTLWQCAVALVVFDVAFLLFPLPLMIGERLQGNETVPSQIARYINKLPKVPPWIEIAILISGAILYFIFGVLFLYYTTGTHWVGQLRIGISKLSGASKGHALGSMCLITSLSMSCDAIVVFMEKRSANPASAESSSNIEQGVPMQPVIWK